MKSLIRTTSNNGVWTNDQLQRRPTLKYQHGTCLIWIFRGKLLQMVYKKSLARINAGNS